ncbi:MAG: hypothetical protein KY432_06085, partial [Acidobacteria bacterium]|nr:hypothetical protein [Acidobacteriota bacterium]
ETATPLYRRSSLDRIGPWSMLWLEEDWEYDSRVGALRGEVEFVDVELVEHRDHSGPLLSVGDPLDPWRLHQRSVAHQKVCEHALSAGMHRGSTEMRKFARALFFLGRRCGAAGLDPDARRLVDLSVWIDPDQSDALLYKSVAERVGWKRMGKLAQRTDALR